MDGRVTGVFFFKQKTAYEVRISDWSSDVCSSDLLKCLHKNRWPHRPETIDLGEPTDYSCRRSQDEIRLEASCQCNEEAAGDDPDPIRMNFLEQRAFHGTMSMGHALGADHDMICGHEVICLAGPDERMILFAETQIFLLIKPLRLDAGYKDRLGADRKSVV